jgi:hypothetical protein
MDIIVGYVKAFVRLCNKKDFSHLPERKLVRKGFGQSDDQVEVDNVDESEPVEIGGEETNRIRQMGILIMQGNVEEDSDEEFSSTEDSHVLENHNRRQRRRKSQNKRMMKEQLLFKLDI